MRPCWNLLINKPLICWSTPENFDFTPGVFFNINQRRVGCCLKWCFIGPRIENEGGVIESFRIWPPKTWSWSIWLFWDVPPRIIVESERLSLGNFWSILCWCDASWAPFFWGSSWWHFWRNPEFCGLGLGKFPQSCLTSRVNERHQNLKQPSPLKHEGEHHRFCRKKTLKF